jgi:hypothetical protein
MLLLWILKDQGAILRDDQGYVITSSWGPTQNCPNTVTAEAMGMLYGIRNTLPIYSGPIHLESGNSFLVSELLRNESSKSVIADTVQDIKISMESFHECLVSKIQRTANEAADGLAKLGLRTSRVQVLHGCVPPCVVDRLNSNCNVNSVVRN